METRDEQSNILIGPRATINLTGGTSNVTVRGNYDHHNYRGGWSQGFNLVFSQASSVGILVEHNLFRGSSWPIQNVTGEFRYNLIYGYGHTWLRSGDDGASIHHNVFAPEEGGGELDQGIWFYSGETGIQIYNNTFDGGGNDVSNNDAGGEFPFAGPVVEVSNDSHVVSLRNNLMTYTRDYENSDGTAHVIGDAGTFGSVDYNAFYSPDNSTRDNYDISGMTEGVTPGFAVHDASGSGTRRHRWPARRIAIRATAHLSVRFARGRGCGVEPNAEAVEHPGRVPRALHARERKSRDRRRRPRRQRPRGKAHGHRRDRFRRSRSRSVRQVRVRRPDLP